MKFRGTHFGFRHTDAEGRASGGFIRRNLKRRITVMLGGKERYLNNHTYTPKRHD